MYVSHTLVCFRGFYHQTYIAEASNMDKTLMIVKQSGVVYWKHLWPLSVSLTYMQVPLWTFPFAWLSQYIAVWFCNFKLFYEQIVNV